MPSINYISYSGYKTHETCNAQYWHQYINKTRTGLVENALSAAYGSIVGTLFEEFYVGRMWRRPTVEEDRKALVPKHHAECFGEAVNRGRVFDYSAENSPYPNAEALIQDVQDTVPRGLESIKAHRFVGLDVTAEEKLDRKYGKYTIGGRLDFAMTRMGFGDTVILDGKGSKHRHKYLDGGKPLADGDPVKGEQLQLYSALYHAKHGRYPDGLGYLFWKFDAPQAVEWVSWSKDSVEAVRTKVLDTLVKVDTSSQLIDKKVGKTRLELIEELFPTKTGYHCKLCAYSSVCEDGTKWIQTFEAVQRMRERNKGLPDDLSLGLDTDSV